MDSNESEVSMESAPLGAHIYGVVASLVIAVLTTVSMSLRTPVIEYFMDYDTEISWASRHLFCAPLTAVGAVGYSLAVGVLIVGLQRNERHLLRRWIHLLVGIYAILLFAFWFGPAMDYLMLREAAKGF